MPQTFYFYPSQIFGVELKFKKIVLSENEFRFVVVLFFSFTKIAFVPPLLFSTRLLLLLLSPLLFSILIYLLLASPFFFYTAIICVFNTAIHSPVPKGAISYLRPLGPPTPYPSSTYIKGCKN